MPKDPSKNIDRYKVGGGQMNPFEYQQNQEAISQQNQDDWLADQANETNLPPDQAEAERIRRLLAAYGEPAPAPVEEAETTQAGEVTRHESAKNAAAGESAGPAMAPKSAKKAAAQKSRKQTATRKSAKKAAAPKSSKQTAARKSARKAVAQKGGKQTAARKSAKQSSAGKKSAGKTLARSRKAASSTPKSRTTRKTGRKAATKARATR